MALFTGIFFTKCTLAKFEHEHKPGEFTKANATAGEKVWI